jgi:1-deoxy-D-xylulose-5-phosphate reductoisomerase
MSAKKKISILGSTGSIGYQTLEVIDNMPDDFEINYLTINTKIELLEPQIKKYNPKGVVIQDEQKYKEFKAKTDYKGKILCGLDGLIEASADKNNDILLTALVGFSGVIPTYHAIENGIDIALANKETLVSAGQLITDLAKEKNVNILAVDSEHSAILQSLAGEDYSEIEKIILTASGGPFLNLPKSEFDNITLDQALKHPNWSMGSKITIDSATMMNKGLEVIEAKWLFGLDYSQIDVLVHPQSIIHSMVEFLDGSVKAQLGIPDMKVPISYAINFPHHKKLNYPKMDLAQIQSLTFYKPDFTKFDCLRLAFEALKQGNSATCILNAANEVAVDFFLKSKIKFVDIPRFIEKTLEKVKGIENPSLNELVELDNFTRVTTTNLILN